MSPARRLAAARSVQRARTAGPEPTRWMCALVVVGLLCSATACNRRETRPTPRQTDVVSAEKRYGNDPELVADFNNLSACPLAEGRLDRACAQVQTLLIRIEAKQTTREKRKALRTTLVNLLESKKERTRLMAATALSPELQESATRRALEKAFDQEKAPRIRAVLLRQRCWTASIPLARLAAGLLTNATPDIVRQEAAACLVRQKKLPSEAGPALLRALEDPLARVRSDACAVLGRQRVKGAEAALARQLVDREVQPRCAAALADLGTDDAVAALVGSLEQARIKGYLGLPLLWALSRLSEKPGFAVAVPQLKIIAQDENLAKDIRQIASELSENHK